MIGKLEFTLPEEQAEFQAAVDAMKWKIVVRDMDNWLRNVIKHGHEFRSADAALAGVREELHRTLMADELRLFE